MNERNKEKYLKEIQKVLNIDDTNNLDKMEMVIKLIKEHKEQGNYDYVFYNFLTFICLINEKNVSKVHENLNFFKELRNKLPEGNFQLWFCLNMFCNTYDPELKKK